MQEEKGGWQAKDTSELDRELAGASGLADFLRKNRGSFIERQVNVELIRLLKEKNMPKAELAKKAGMSTVYLYQLLSGRRNPSRDRVICICIGRGCSLEETQEFLKKCRYVPLYARIRRDAAIMYAMQRGWSVEELNDNLFEIEEETMF